MVELNEASSTSGKRQRFPSIIKVAATGNRDRDVDEVKTTEIPRNLLDCPVCFNALTIPTFQCNNGHIACSSCCTKMNYKCPTCKAPIGIRCRFAESIVEASIVPCPNAKHGCTDKFSYGKELAHEEKCGFALCYCPAPKCNYTGMYEDLYTHYDANHQDMLDYFDFGISLIEFLYNGMKHKVIQEYTHGPLVVVQCFKVEQGMQVTVDCIAPCDPEVGKLSYHISYLSGHHTLEFGTVEMKRIQKVSLQNPEKGSCMFVPDYFLNEDDLCSKMRFCIRRLEDGEAEEGGEDGEEHSEE